MDQDHVATGSSRAIRSGACVCTTLRGEVSALRSFIEYHLAIGFEHIYLFFDGADDPGIPLARDYPRVTVTPVDDELLGRQLAGTELPHLVRLAGTEVMARQELNVEMAVRWARTRGLGWLLHIDIDELFWPGKQRVPEYFEKLSTTDVGCCTFLNLEAVPERLVIQDYFLEVTLFRTNWRSLPQHARPANPRGWFRAYGNGKAAVRLCEGVIPTSVHTFIVPEHLRQMVTDLPCILHFVNCGYARWKAKYEMLGDFPDAWSNGQSPIPFECHLRSRDVNRSGSEAQKRAFYEEQMLETNPEKVARLLSAGLFQRIDGPQRVLTSRDASRKRREG